MPSQQIPLRFEFERTRRAELHPRALLHLNSEPVHAPFFQHVLKPRMFPIGAVAKISVHGQNCLGTASKCSGVRNPITSAMRGKVCALP